MIKNYFKTTFRHLWRNRMFSALNVLGLAIGISACWIIYRMVDYEYSFDKKLPDVERIYQLVNKSKNQDGEEGGFAGVEKPVVNVLLGDVSGAELVVPMFYQYYNSVSIPTGKQQSPTLFDRQTVQVATLPDYFDMMEYQWLAGDRKTALDGPDRVVLTDKRAREYFPDLSPDQILGKTLIYDDTLHKQVSGVVAALDYPNSFNRDNTEFIRIAEADLNDDFWGGMSSNDLVFVKAQANTNPQHIVDQVNVVGRKFNAEQFAKYHYESWYELLPMTERHFSTQFGAQTRTANKNVLYGLMAVGAFLLALACINYINLTTALLPQRAREIGIRKTLGSTTASLIGQFIGETFVVTLLALGLSFLLTFFASKVFSVFLPEGMFDYVNYGGMLLFTVLLITGIALLSGLYPAFLSTKVSTVNVLKGQMENVVGRNRLSLRKALIVFQFLVAQVFIVSAVIMGQQLHYTLKKDLGFNKDALITIDVPYKVYNRTENKDKESVLANELRRLPALSGVALGDRPMDNRMMSNMHSYFRDTVEIQKALHMKMADTAYAGVYGLKFLAGRNIRPSDTINELVINEKASKAFGFSAPEEAVGEMLVIPSSGKTYPIVGVVGDFHQMGLRSEIQPTAIVSQKSRLHTFNIKLPKETAQWQGTIQAIEKEWNKIYPGVPFEYRFYDKFIEEFYESDRNTQTLVKAATGITIFISCLGLFGLATLMAFQRSKEIGIRKVLGATVQGIVVLLSRDFVKLVLIAIVIASPIAWWAMNKWLEDFVYHIDIQWWMFALAGLAAVAIALFTISWQAIKAAMANPVKSLRDE
ncbi:FtsX-like permease family protein [Olivibacter sitiensis]|uniref:FtsX-like permease family protein n=1 Tax=Olivibacter sitiensis TaxID=376470 RepID=UPI000410BC99|nr:FtsX-like permease family protein [Olivibacter sitiensis]